MKTAYWIGAIVIVLILAGLIVRAAGSSHMNSQPSATTTQTDNVNTVTTNSTTTVTTSSTSSAPAQQSAPAAKYFTVNGNDQSADVKVITVTAGTPVTITFGADAGSTYHGGLDYRSSVVNTGTIAPGSKKTISFTATHSFSFTPYWPATNIAKPYTIDVVVH